MRYITVLILTALWLVSCVTPPARDSSSVQKVDGKILEEFEESRAAEDFYGAARSYIEFMNCCEDERIRGLREEIGLLYRNRIDDFKIEGKSLELIEYTYSYLLLTKDTLTDDEQSALEKDLEKYVRMHIETGLRNMGTLEKASWLMYLDRFASPMGSTVTREELVELFLNRNNPVMAGKYMTLLEETTGKNEENERERETLKGRVSKLQEQKEAISEGAIDRTVKSSVKIIVDRGIKTDRGVGVPDQALGTGIIIDPRGYILTNYHIIESDVDPSYEGYSRVYVISAKDENVRFVARVVGYDSVFDLALLKIEKEFPSLIMVGDSDTLKQGEQVVAIGNPVGLTNTVTSGVVSSIDRPFLQIGGIIQIDAALNPGNSGGALINNSGYLVGIAFAGLANFENLNFAIPSNHMLSILGRLYAGDQTKRSWIGCAIDEREDDLIIEYLVPNNPADMCGLQQGDIIRSVNDREVSSVLQIQDIISNLNSPMIVSMEIVHGGKMVERKVYLEERPVQPSLYIYKKDATENILTPLFGMVLSNLDSERKKNYVVQRTLSNSVASSVGISEGDKIRLRELRYDEQMKVFQLIIDLESKRFGYINKSMILTRYLETNSFI